LDSKNRDYDIVASDDETVVVRDNSTGEIKALRRKDNKTKSTNESSSSSTFVEHLNG